MNILKEEVLKSGFTMKIVLGDTNTISVRLENKKGEFVGQSFTSKENLEKTINKMTNNEVKLSKSDLDSILEAINSNTSEKTSPKNESRKSLIKKMLKLK